ncbi:stalk domain-containing protein [Paenibacillus allorhizosphaerae]|uniref:Copper amine oxidase-like N-terminal domain-containing protein n=1 Tax=Paenibacillus allorhizosphaerae TaxID=2849866 RepID=A0ABM8VLB1_9BACL|nr:copper amine oxidase N-terminal domain-containing protein [Paenibacillus allorhizosphaerae]CAG7648255.1 hypothetical protein PAECIP111802_04163 [Paenibacillus allorhizosphaerae]
MKRKYIISLSILSMLAVSGMAWAEGRYQTIEVYFDRIQIKMNGQSAPLSKDSIIYNGSVYVPIKNLSELLGATVSWDDATRSVNMDFFVDKSNELFASSQQGVYQYITFEYNQTMSDLLEQIKSNNTDGMKKTIERFSRLNSIAKDMKDEELSSAFEKLMAATEMLRSGWQSKNLDEYYLAWSIFKTNASRINDLLQQKTAGSNNK